jgi:hypothetical protein
MNVAQLRQPRLHFCRRRGLEEILHAESLSQVS